MTVLTIGAAGNLAGLVVPALVARGIGVRGFVRKQEQAKIARERGASEVSVGDLRDIETLQPALKSVHAVFYIGPAFDPSEVDFGNTMIKATLQSGIRRFVF